jgi:hypothetical protein
LNSNGGSLAIDGCTATSGLSWSNNFNGLSDGCGFTGTVTVVFTVRDECGNDTSTTASFTIADTTAPTITAPANLTVDCGSDNTNALVQTWLQSYTAGDVCSGVMVSNNFSALPSSSCSSPGNVLTVTWTATDSCGRIATAQATVTMVDSTKPVVMTSPQNLTLSCMGSNNAALISTWVSNNAGAQFADACDQTLTITTIAGTPIQGCGGTTVTLYTITATDDCGNSLIRYAEVIIIDTIPPVLTLPTAVNTVSCSGSISSVRDAWLSSAIASDGCSATMPVISASLQSTTDTCVGTIKQTIERYLFTAKDACGIMTMGTAVFTILDNTAPNILSPGNLIVSCGANNATAITAWLDNYTVVEACQNYTVTNDYNGNLPNLCILDSIKVRWTVLDGCGASDVDSAYIISTIDNTPPVFINCPGNMTVNVDAAL